MLRLVAASSVSKASGSSATGPSRGSYTAAGSASVMVGDVDGSTPVTLPFRLKLKTASVPTFVQKLTIPNCAPMTKVLSWMVKVVHPARPRWGSFPRARSAGGKTGLPRWRGRPDVLDRECDRRSDAPLGDCAEVDRGGGIVEDVYVPLVSPCVTRIGRLPEARRHGASGSRRRPCATRRVVPQPRVGVQVGAREDPLVEITPFESRRRVVVCHFERAIGTIPVDGELVSGVQV